MTRKNRSPAYAVNVRGMAGRLAPLNGRWLLFDNDGDGLRWSAMRAAGQVVYYATLVRTAEQTTLAFLDHNGAESLATYGGAAHKATVRLTGRVENGGSSAMPEEWGLTIAGRRGVLRPFNRSWSPRWNETHSHWEDHNGNGDRVVILQAWSPRGRPRLAVILQPADGNQATYRGDARVDYRRPYRVYGYGAASVVLVPLVRENPDAAPASLRIVPAAKPAVVRSR
jgi:hypothetical protein